VSYSAFRCSSSSKTHDRPSKALRRGKANKVIAYELNMRESTVKVHVRNIMKKLKARNRTEVAFMANELMRSQNGRAG